MQFSLLKTAATDEHNQTISILLLLIRITLFVTPLPKSYSNEISLAMKIQLKQTNKRKITRPDYPN